MIATQPTILIAGKNVTAIPIPSLPFRKVVTAIEHIRLMRGGSQAHLMRCSDGHFYVVKFRNNPQSPRVLVNEYIAGKLAKLLGLPCPNICPIEVKEDLIRLTPDLSIQCPRSTYPVASGFAFGSQFPSWRCGKKRILLPVLDLRVAFGLGQVENIFDLLGILMFDKWTSNTDNRQIVCVEQPTVLSRTFHLLMIDNGFCFGDYDWRFTDMPRHGLYHDRTIYSKIEDSKLLHSWLERLETNVTLEELNQISEELPKSWVNGDRDELLRMLKSLYERKKTVASLVHLTLNSLKSRHYSEISRAAGAV
jgi:hypothetical protein